MIPIRVRDEPGRDGLIPGAERADPMTMDQHNSSAPSARRSSYLNAVLTVIAVLMAITLLDRHVAPALWTGPSSAMAQPGSGEEGGTDGTGLISAGEQRKQMLAELRRMNMKLDKIETKINAGVSVKVTDMPALKLPEGGKSGG